MSALVADIVSRCQIKFPAMSEDLALRLLNEVNEDILSYIGFIEDESTDLVLAADDQEYELSVRVTRILAVWYFTSSTEGRPLRAVTKDGLDYLRPYWRTMSSGEPQEYWVQGSNIGLVPAPATASSSGYPTVRIYYRLNPAQTLRPGDSVAVEARNAHAWQTGLMFRASEIFLGPGESESYRLRHQITLDALKREQDSRQVRKKPRVIQYVPRIARW